MTTAHDTSRIRSLTAQEILAIDENDPERLFTGDVAALKQEYQALAKIWHPDANRSSEAEKVFTRINVLHKNAVKKLEAGHWSTPGLLHLTDVGGRAYKVHYLKKHDFELGSFYISKSFVTFVIDKATSGDLAANGLNAISGIKYKDDNLRKEFSRTMPELVKSFDTNDSVVCVFKKDPDMILLSDLFDYIVSTTKAPLDSKHAAWIMSRLHSLTCFLQLNGLTHNGISARTLFVSPPMHTAALIGGWWYAAKEHTALVGLPGDALDVVSSKILDTGKATQRIDAEMVRAVGREVLGDTSGSLLLRDDRVPKPMAHWLTNTPSDDAFADFRNWSQDVLKSSFGPRRFTELKVTFSDVYPPL